ncbi:hypothetical protein N1495_06520 [Streptococcus didelphis]|uniref:Uncharacterized protein n=1 Tax=Streptococcus didelphis TaxID=102886 RepID=A0ABY9LHV1_9STRE|nr:hypothetical protein [Streptococcus didelphis]WMB28422.1 hypothetical protein N1496_02095 [Streptococcus didelphis]WMB29097.1 hypothetical protein N1495_06520 [Streptococcus didelphis]
MKLLSKKSIGDNDSQDISLNKNLRRRFQLLAGIFSSENLK